MLFKRHLFNNLYLFTIRTQLQVKYSDTMISNILFSVVLSKKCQLNSFGKIVTKIKSHFLLIKKSNRKSGTKNEPNV